MPEQVKYTRFLYAMPIVCYVCSARVQRNYFNEMVLVAIVFITELWTDMGTPIIATEPQNA